MLDSEYTEWDFPERLTMGDMAIYVRNDLSRTKPDPEPDP